MAEDLAPFLAPAPGIQSDHPEVLAMARAVIAGARGELDMAERLFLHARECVAYSPYVPFHRIEDYLALNTLARGRGYCVQKSALLTALARSVGMPARLCFADIRNHQLPEGLREMMDSDVMAHHCYAELYADGRWIKVTPSFEEALCTARGWRLVEFDERGAAMLPETDLAGRPHISYLKKHGWRVGVPVEEILQAWLATYGEQRVGRWIEMVEAAGDFHPGEAR